MALRSRRSRRSEMSEILTITLNPAVDVSTAVDHIAPAHKLRCQFERRDAGGGGINVARVIKRLGGDVEAAYPAGGPIGEYLKRLVQAEGVESLVVPITGDTRESFTVRERSTAHEFRFVLPGPTLDESTLQAVINLISAAETPPRFVVVSGGLPPGLADDTHARLATAARKVGARVVLDASGPSLKAALERGVFLIKPNLRELQELVGSTLEDPQSIVAAGRQIVRQSQAELVAISLSERGALLISANEAFVANAISVQVIGTVGAGDSFLGAMVWALAAGHSVQAAFRHGLAAGAAALLTPGTELARPEDIRRLLTQATLRPI